MSWSQRERAKIIANGYKNWHLRGKKVLDVGCGNAVVSKVLIDVLDIDLYGTDIIDYRKENISFKQMENENKLPFDDSSFDYVMFNDILHHTINVEALLTEADRIAENVLIFEDCSGLLMNIIDIGLNHFYCSKMSCPLNFRTEQEWELLFKSFDFEVEKCKLAYPVWYPLRHMGFKLTRRK